MLHGKLTFRDDHVGIVEYELYARDSFIDFKMYLINDLGSNFQNHIRGNMVYDKVVLENGELENPYNDQNPSTSRRIDLKKASKYKTNVTNYDFASKVCAFLHYIFLQGKINYNQSIHSDEEYFQTHRHVDLGNFGTISYNMGLVTSLAVQNDFVRLELRTVPDDIFDTGIFRELKMKDKYDNILSATPIKDVGFKLTKDLLGFDYVPPAVSDSINIFGMYENIEDVIAAHPDKNTSWILDRDYHIVTDENLEEVMQKFYDHKGFIAFDTETTGLKINFKSRIGQADQLVGVVLSYQKGEGYYFPLQHKQFKNLCNGDHFYFMEKYMKQLLESRPIICHNLSFDWKVAYIYDIGVNCVYDTMLAFGVTKRYEEKNFSMSLKALVRNLFGLDMFDLGDFVTGSSFGDSDITFADLPYELVRRYAPADTDMTLTLFEFIEKEGLLHKYQAHRIFEQEVNFSKVVAYSEFYGYHVNVDKVPEMRETILGNMEKYKQEMVDIAGHDFNPNSPKQLGEIMYDELGIEIIGKKRSTAKDTLHTLSERTDEYGNKKYPFVDSLTKYRQNEGIYKNFLKRLSEFSTEDGFIFPGVQQLGTDTGRSSVKDPNYQSYNDPVKKNIVPREGYYHFDCDFSQIEYRVLASMAKQEQLMVEFDDPDLDYHTYQASRMFSIPYSLVSKALRSQSKGINFGLPYGMGDSSLGARIFGERTPETQQKATVLRRKFFQGQEKIEMFFETVRNAGVANSFTSTHFGRRRYYHRGIFDVGAIRRQAGNHVIQGTAADIYKEACNRMFNRIVEEGWLGLVMINVFVHDELLMEVHRSIDPYYFFKAWREEFQLEIDGFCKLYAGAGVGYSWYEAKKQDLPIQYISEIVDSYDPEREWDEDIDAYIKSINDKHEEYKIRRVKEYIVDPENQGTIIKPVIYALLVEKTVDVMKEISVNPAMHAEYNSMFGEEKIPLNIGGNPSKYKHKIKTLDEYLRVFCRYHGVDREKVDMKSPDEADAKSTNTNEEVPSLMFEDDSFTIKDLLEIRGFYRDEVNNVVYFIDKTMVYQGVNTTVQHYLASTGAFKHSGSFQVALFDPQTENTTLYNAFMNEADYQTMMQLYNIINGSQVGSQFAGGGGW